MVEIWPQRNLPSAWVEMQLNDILVSDSGTVRIFLKKNWARTVVYCLRFAIAADSSHDSVSLDIEEINVNLSDFSHLAKTAHCKNAGLAESDLRHFTRAVRVNALTLVGFGPVGSEMYSQLLSSKNWRGAQPQQYELAVDLASGEIAGLRRSGSIRRAQEDAPHCAVTISVPQPDVPYIQEVSMPKSLPGELLRSLELSARCANTLLVAGLLRREVLERR